METNNEKKSFYITTAIIYPNAEMHMGQTYELYVADVIARYKRQRGFAVYFLTGTDEHGVKIARKAKEAGKDPQAFVDEKAQSFKALEARLNISYDQFIRTSDKVVHWPGAQAMWGKLAANGDIYKKFYTGLYCVGCEKFKTEKELVDGKCPDHNTVPEKVEEENYFFKLSKYGAVLLQKIESGELAIEPVSARNEMLALIKGGLDDVSFSRKEEAVLWGIPVPSDPTQLMYVWCDALVNYISALGYGRSDHVLYDAFWPADVHVIGKDIVRFHAAFWPAMLISAGLPLPKKIFAHGHITSDGKKMSKTIGNVLYAGEFIDGYGAEALRYYLGREIAPTEDGDFTREKFQTAYNANLANGLGNLVSRTLKMVETYFSGTIDRQESYTVPIRIQIEGVADEYQVDQWSVDYFARRIIEREYVMHMDAFQINKAADALWRLIKVLDGYIADYEPYKLFKENPEKAKAVLWSVLEGLLHVSVMLEPFMPETAATIAGLLGTEKDQQGVPVRFVSRPPEAPLFLRK